MLKTAVFEQLKQAMRDKDVLSKGVLTLLKAALDKAEKEKGATLTQEEEVAVVNREVKQTNQALDGAKDAGREDLIEKEEAKLELLKSFLPKQLSEEEIRAEISKLEDKTIPSIMKHFKANFAGKVNMSLVSQIAREL